MQDSPYAIRVQGLGKLYRLGLSVDFARNLTDTFKSLTGWNEKRGAGRRERKTKWALRDVSFDVRPGETVGIIGRNGAGKSTLLKILSRITWPTEGLAEIRGRVGSLLEVGTGFHPELTGRENIYLNGAILGMRRGEIARKFDEIVAFSGVGEILDTPVKRYSSGERVRLAFAVAANLEPEVLVIDEVLAVGDAEFQNKCLGKMHDVAGGGRTVLFVSHNMQAIKQLCQRGIVLEEGRIGFSGTAEEAVEDYLNRRGPGQSVNEITAEMHYKPDPSLEIYRVRIINSKGEATDTLKMDEAFTIQMDYRIHQGGQGYRLGIVFKSQDDVRLATSLNIADNRPLLRGQAGASYRITAKFVNPFQSGRFQMDLLVKNQANEYVNAIQGLPFNIAAVAAGDSDRLVGGGYVRLRGEWDDPVELEESGASCCGD